MVRYSDRMEDRHHMMCDSVHSDDSVSGTTHQYGPNLTEHTPM